MEIQTNLYQEAFLRSKARFPALIAAIATGKTFMGLLKLWMFCEKYPNSLAMIVRKEYTDLRDSTLKDIKNYFGVDFDSNKEYTFPNGSVVMARHGAELAVLKNVNLSIFLIEQAEEFETEETFVFLRDRLRRQTSPYRQGLIIANARGHNWLWKLWVNSPDETKTIDEATGQHIYRRGEYECVTAQSYANRHNLPEDFVRDLEAMAQDAPHHHAQYVLNSFEEMEEDDYVFNFAELTASRSLQFSRREGYHWRIMGFDIARYGNDKCAAVAIEQCGALTWQLCHAETWEKHDLDYTTGRILATAAQIKSNDNIVDEDGLGGGPLDFITVGRKRNDFRGFRNRGLTFHENSFFGNPRTSAAFRAKELVSKGYLKITDEAVIQELMTLRYKFMNDGRKILVSKEELRKQGIKSPNLADALLYAVSLVDEAKYAQDTQYGPLRPQTYKEEDLFALAGVM